MTITDLLGSEPVGGWLNGTATLSGKRTIVHFWAVSCGTCKHQMASVRRWLADGEVVVVGVHTPLTDGDRDPVAVERAARAHGLSHAIALDTDGSIADRFGVLGLPAYFVFDTDGRQLAYAAGEGADRSVVTAAAAA